MSASEIFRKMMPSFDPADLDKKVDVKTIDMRHVETVVRVWPRLQHAMNYEVFSIDHLDDDGVPQFWMKGATDNFTTTANLDEAQPDFFGWIKFDGCSESSFGHYHGCSRADLVRFGQIFDRLFDEAIVMMPRGKEFLR